VGFCRSLPLLGLVGVSSALFWVMYCDGLSRGWRAWPCCSEAEECDGWGGGGRGVGGGFFFWFLGCCYGVGLWAVGFGVWVGFFGRCVLLWLLGRCFGGGFLLRGNWVVGGGGWVVGFGVCPAGALVVRG